MSWTASTSEAGPVSYRVFVGRTAQGPYTEAGRTETNSFAYSSGYAGTAYYFRVAAYDSYGTRSDWVAAGPVSATWKLSPHVSKETSSDLCSRCHAIHETTGGTLMREGVSAGSTPESGVCFSCHDGRGAQANVKNGDEDSFALDSGHSIEGTRSADSDLTKECSSCHNPHAQQADARMLPATTINGTSLSSSGSDWCLTCHEKSGDWFGTDYPSTAAPTVDASGYPVAGTWPGPSVYSSSANAHRLIPETTQTPESGLDIRREEGDCLYCHAAHRGANAYDGLLDTFRPSTSATLATDKTDGTYAASCFACHGGVIPSGFTTAPADIKQFATADSPMAGHRIESEGADLPVGSPLPCYECHNPHGSDRGNDSLISDVLGEGLETDTDAGVRQFCFACHTASDTQRGWDSVESTFAPVPSSDKVVGLSRTEKSPLWLPSMTAHTEASTTSCYACHGSSYASGGANVHNPTASGYDPGTHTGSPAATTYTIDSVTFPSRPCEECHSVELGAEHLKPTSSSAGEGCATCHPAPRSTLVPWDRSCSQGGCHTVTSSAPMHGSIDASHTAPSNSCTTAGCHAGESIAALHSEATTTTAGVTRTSCQVCHSADEELTADCSTCHGATPHGDLDAAHTAIPGTGDIWMGLNDSDHNDMVITEDCLRCHYADVRTQHANQCATCHAGSNPAGSLGTWDRTCQQGACHTSIHSGMTDNHNGVYYNSSVSCNECHDTSGDFPGPGDNCDRCHKPADTIPDGVAPTTTSDALGSYAGTADIALTATDGGGSGVATTHYKLDLGAWQSGQSVSVAPPSGGVATHTLAFYSVDLAGNSETPQTVIFTVSGPGSPDTTGPSGTMTVDSDAAYTKATTRVTASVIDDESGLYGMSVDPGTGTFGDWVAYDPDFAITLPSPDGPKTVRVQYKDYAGNTTTISDSVTLDTAAPSTTCAATQGTIYTGDQAFALNASDSGSGIANTWYQLDSEPPVFGSSVEVTAPVSGSASHTIHWNSTDNAGNTESTHSVTFTVQAVAPDTTAPTTISSFNPAEGAVFNSAQAVTLTATDDIAGSGVKDTYYRIDAGADTTGTVFTVSGEGLHTFSYYSADSADNTETVHTSNQFRIDTVAPVTMSDIVGGNTYTGVQIFSLVPSDPSPGSGIAGTVWQLDDTTGTWSAGTSVPVVAVGTHTLYWYSTDVAGNTEDVQSVTFTIEAIPDVIAPTTTSSFNPAEGAVFNSAQAVTLTATDDIAGSGVKDTYYRIDAGADTTGTAFTVSGEGLHTFSYYSVDSADNTETVHTSNQFRIDTVAPVTMSDIIAGNTYTGAQLFSLTPGDPSPGSGVVGTFWQLDGTTGGWTAGTSAPVVAPGSGTEAHTLYWYSVDAAGNTEGLQSVAFSLAAQTGTDATLVFHWYDSSVSGIARLRVLDEAGATVSSVDLSGPGTDLDWAVVVPAGQRYRMYCHEADDGTDNWYGEIWTDDPSINPDGILSPGETIDWWY